MEDHSHAFIIRIWYEAGELGEKNIIWRGSIEHVGANQRLYFCNLEGIARFIQEQLGIQGRSPLTWWQSILRRIRHGIFALRKS